MTPTHAQTHSLTHTHIHTDTNIYIYIHVSHCGNNGKDRTRTLAMMARMPGSRQEVREEEGVTFHILSSLYFYCSFYDTILDTLSKS